MAPPHGFRLAPLRALLLALPILSLLLILALHLPARHRPTPPAPLILPTPLLRTTTATNTQSAAKADLSSSSSTTPSQSPTTLSHVVFGIASTRRTLPLRLRLLRAWLRPPARAFVFLDAPPRATAALPANLHLRVSRNASRFPYTHRRGLPSAVRVARIATELLLDLRQHQSPPPRWLVLGDDDTAFVLPNLLHTLSKYDWREPWYLGARSESAAQNALHGYAMAFGGGGIAISWPLADRLARVLDSCIIRYPHLYGSDGRIYACLAELGVELTHEPGFHQPAYISVLHTTMKNKNKAQKSDAGEQSKNKIQQQRRRGKRRPTTTSKPLPEGTSYLVDRCIARPPQAAELLPMKVHSEHPPSPAPPSCRIRLRLQRRQKQRGPPGPEFQPPAPPS